MEREKTFVDRAMKDTAGALGVAAEIVGALAGELYPKETIEVYRARAIQKVLRPRGRFH